MKLEKTNLLKEKERLEKENKELKKTIKILEGELDIEKDISDGMLEAIDKTIDYTTKQMKKYEGYDRDFEIVLSNIVVMLGSDKE